GAREYGDLTDPSVRAVAARESFFSECQPHAGDREEDTAAARERQALATQRGRQPHRHERERREDQRSASRRNVGEAVVEERDQDAELRDAEERDRQHVARREAWPAGEERRRQQAAEADRVPQERERRG